ncbi:MAG: winged helix-turn-helix transcriptional regulator [Methanomethylophilus sp.]|jgi:DNA-binding HxlR family transcriptional regulator
MNREPRYDCALDAAMSVIEGRWKTVIMCKLCRNGAPMRYNQLMNSIEGISPRIFTIQLKEMEADGIITRNVVSERPKVVEYSLTERGLSLIPILKELAAWGLQNMFSNMVELPEDAVVPEDAEIRKAVTAD